MSKILVAVAILLLALFGSVAVVVQRTAPSEAKSVMAPAFDEAESTQAPETTQVRGKQAPVAPTPPVPASPEMKLISRHMDEFCSARTGVPIPEPEDLAAEGDEGFDVDPKYLECLAAQGKRPFEAILAEARAAE